MKKILIFMDVSENEYNIYEKTDYLKLNDVIQTERKGNCPNYGNKVWLQALISEITIEGTEYSFWNPQMTYEEINSTYDCVIKPSANIFSPEFVQGLERLSRIFSNIKIPIYVIACGLQLKKYEDMDSLVSAIREPADRFIRSIYATGGEFALRGHITKKFFEKLGFNTPVVTGCPSLFQNGRDLKITKRSVQETDFSAVVNGQNYMLSMPFYINIFKKYPKSIFIDQDHYYDYLYNPNYFSSESFSMKDMLRRVKDKGYQGLDLVSDSRLHLFADMPNWHQYLINSDHSFSFGSRIHGNIMSLLSGIPAVIHPCDCRTEEMADFFDIPKVNDSDLKNYNNLYDLYSQVDFSKFNSTFAEKYDYFRSFFVQRGLVSNDLNQNNIFWNNESNNNGAVPIKINDKYLSKLHQSLHRHSLLYKTESTAFHLYRSVKNK